MYSNKSGLFSIHPGGIKGLLYRSGPTTRQVHLSKIGFYMEQAAIRVLASDCTGMVLTPLGPQFCCCQRGVTDNSISISNFSKC